MKIIISIPAYNEEKSIGKTLEDIKRVMKRYNYKILVVDDGSKDKTADIAKEHDAKVVSHPYNLGLTEAFRTEMREALKMKPDIIIHTDADNQYPAEYIPLLIKKIEEGYDLVLGSRFGKGAYSGSLMKKLGNIAFAKVFSGLLKSKITDTTTGFRGFTPKVAKIPLINNFTYTQEQIIKAGKARMGITEIPIKTNRTRPSRLFKNSFDYAIKAWINIIRIYRDFEPLKFFGKIGGILFLSGFLIGLWIFYIFLTKGYVGKIPLTIFSMLLMTMGIQIVLFGFLADMKK